MKRYVEPLSLGKALVMLLAGVIVGTVFVFGMRYWNAEADREFCILVETQFEGYSEIRRRSRVQEIRIDCANGESYSIDGACVTDAQQDAISGLEAGDKLTMLLHPNSDNIVELICDGEEIVNFDETMDRLGSEKLGFLIFGIFAYLCAAVGLYYTIRHIVWVAKGKGI